MDHDRNLLFGVFAVQLGKVSSSDIMAAAAAWSSDPEKDLPSRLVNEFAMSGADRALIEKLVDQAIQHHQGDATATLDSFGGNTVVDATFRGAVTIHDSVARPTSTSVESNAEPPAESLDVRETPGRYAMRAEHARGSQGLLWLAYDQQLKREVILKELLPDAAGSRDASTPRDQTPVVVGRFLREARVTGQLEHPAIVPVYELGRREGGHLYYTMKYVRGRTLAEAIHERPNLRDRLALLPHFVDVCQGVAYAHSRGVIHRDLKPTNVMVSEFGETVLLDWGLAKERGSIDADDSEATRRVVNLDEIPETDRTIPGEVLGTPAYMAPEQARGEIDGIDERTDVYALGAMLYHCITGHAPFRKSSLREMIKQVTSEPPPTILSVEPETPRELAAICGRAMQKRPDDRYASAGELAREIERFLSGAVVEAHQYKIGDHLARWISRNRGVFATATTAVLALIVLAAYAFVRISIERNDAINARVDADVQRERAEENFAFARDAVDRLYTQIGSSDLLKRPGLQPVREELLGTALDYYEQFLVEQSDDPAVQMELANAYLRVGSISLELGNYDRAKSAYEKELAIRTVLAKTDAEQQTRIGYAHRNLAVLSLTRGRPAVAREHITAAFEAVDRSLEADTDDVTAQWLRAHLYAAMGDVLREERNFERAAEYYRRHLAALDTLPVEVATTESIAGSRAAALVDLAFVYAILEDFVRERESLESAVAIRRELAEAHPDDQSNQANLAQNLTSLAITYARNDENNEAAALLEQTIDTLKSISEANPAVDIYRYALARSYSTLGPILEELGQPQAALDTARRALTIMEDLYTKFPDASHYKAMGATAYARVRRMERDLGVPVALTHKEVTLQMPRVQGPIILRIAAQSLRTFESELKLNDIDFDQTGGIVLPDLPFLARIGLQGGDIIRSINDEPMVAVAAAIPYLDRLAEELTNNAKATIRLDVERWKHEHVSIAISFE